jgi:hypothetical protein
MAQAPRRRQRQKAHFREAGAEHVIVYTDEDFVANIASRPSGVDETNVGKAHTLRRFRFHDGSRE